MSKTLEDVFDELNDGDIKAIIAKRFPCDLNIEIISKRLSEEPVNAYIDVALYFVDAKTPRDTFYTHLYISDVTKYFPVTE